MRRQESQQKRRCGAGQEKAREAREEKVREERHRGTAPSAKARAALHLLHTLLGRKL